MRLDDFDYHLPEELIAQSPAAERRASRLLHLDGANGALQDLRFTDLPGLLQAGDLLILNDTKVIMARLMGQKASGGRIEVLIERVLGSGEALAQIRASHPPKAGSELHLEGGLVLEMVAREGELYRLRFPQEDVFAQLERYGALPLPPYIEHRPGVDDETRYQTVFARTPGAVAAPTAGLHFDAALLEALRDQGIGTAYLTLHVGAGTFQPVKTENLAEHRMHSEWYDVPAATQQALADCRARGGRVVAVGTTTVRTLESWAQSGQSSGETQIFITPGFAFQVVDLLVTNFHLPKSTLMMLVSAFAGYEPIMALYRHAIAQGYRFFSYGDAMLLARQPESDTVRSGR
jgi:S-adenosylmethionine:tRNA ribosyltransferase-isomerase